VIVPRFSCCVSLLAFACAALAEVTAQAPKPGPAPTPTPAATKPTERAPTLHDAWLFEVLDLDIPKAVAAYTKVAADQGASNPDRWVAVARLAELKRLGVDVTLHVDLKEVPEPLRAPLTNIISDRLPVADLLQRVQGDPTEVLQRIGTEAGRLPPLHPVTFVAEEWRLAQIPSFKELLSEQNRRARGGFNRNPDWVNQVNADNIVRMELGGWPGTDARRALWFLNWQPPKLPGDPQPWLEKFRTNLEACLKDPDQTQKNLLRDLREAVNEKAATDPAAALALVARLPIYAEKLLGLPAANR
jgi:hypothetical protein